jgi:hypothetical protein
MVNSRKNLHYPREVCSRNPEKIRHAGVQIHEYTHGNEAKAIGRHLIRIA